MAEKDDALDRGGVTAGAQEILELTGWRIPAVRMGS